MFDEFDALGSNRAATNDVGEIHRVLNSFLQFLEAELSDSILVAATNHPALLDSALFRRFDLLRVARTIFPKAAVIEKMIRSTTRFFRAGRVSAYTRLPRKRKDSPTPKSPRM